MPKFRSVDNQSRCLLSSINQFIGPEFLHNTKLEIFSAKNNITNNHLTVKTQINIINSKTVTSNMRCPTLNWKYYSQLDKMVRHVTWRNWVNWKRNKQQKGNFNYLNFMEIEIRKPFVFRISQIESYLDSIC